MVSVVLKDGKKHGVKYEYNGRVYFCQIPTITRQYLGSGKTKTSAKAEAVAAANKLLR